PAVFGAGGIAGAAAAAGLVGARTLVRPLALAALVWAASYVLLAAFTTLAGALAFLLAAGAARSVLDTGGRALLARITPATWLGRRFRALERLAVAALP